MATKALKAEEAAEVTGVTADWTRKIVRRYNEEGPQGVYDKRKANGTEPLLSRAIEPFHRKGA